MDEKTSLVQKQNRPSRWTREFVLSYALLYGFALNITGRAEPQFIYAYLKEHTDLNETNNVTTSIPKECGRNNEDSIQKQASSWTWYFTVSEYGVAIPIVILVGPMADRVGRKPILLWNAVFTFLSFAFRTVIVYMSMDLYWLIIAHVVSGISGTFYTFDLANHAIMADITDNTERSFIMVIFDSFLGISVTCAQLLTGYLIELTGYTYPFLITSVVLLLYILIVHVTLTDTRRQLDTGTKLSISSFLMQIFTLFRQKSIVTVSIFHFILFFIVYILYYFPFNSFVTIRTLYQLGPPFCWNPVHVGWFGAGEDIELFIVATFIMKILQYVIVDETIAVLGLVSSVGCFVFYGLSDTDWMLYGATAVGLLRILCIPLLKAIMSRLVITEKQGVLFSNICLVAAACAVGGSSVFNNIYYETRPLYKGLVFFVMAGFQLLGTILILYAILRKSSTSHTDLVVHNPDVQTERIEK